MDLGPPERTPLDETELLSQVSAVLLAPAAEGAERLRPALHLVEEAWPGLKLVLSLTDGQTVATVRPAPEDPSASGDLPLTRGGRVLGSLGWSAGPARPAPGPAGLRVLAALLAQEAELQRRYGGVPTLGNLVGSSGLMQEVFRLAELAAASSAPLLITGEPGVGKEVLSAAIHRRSAVRSGPFVVFNGAALPDTMIETELFGLPRRGGGRLNEARGGTLFVDEAGDLSADLLARLFRTAGDRRAPVRLLLSTSRGPSALGAWRPLQTLAVPPLRERGSDIVALADHFVSRFSLQTGKAIKRISTPTLEMLLAYPWPGNVRELETVLERAVLLSDDEVIHGYHLPPSLQTSMHSQTRMAGRLEDRLDSLEYEMIVDALKASRGNITQAARELGLTKRVLGLRLAKYELDYRPFRQGPLDLAGDPDWN